MTQCQFLNCRVRLWRIRRSQNIAQADTPGYRAKDMQGFAETVARVAGSEPMRATRQNHVQTAMGGEQGGEII